MHFGSRKADRATRRSRWLKYFMYIIITGVVVLGMVFHLFNWVALIIVLAAVAEWIKVSGYRAGALPALAFFVLLSTCTCFYLFSKAFNDSFLLFVYFQVMVFDGFCQITGQLFGKTALVPAISPSKTVEGLVGGWLFCTGVAAASAGWIALPWYKGILFGVLTGATAFTGDICASWYKRKMKVKDYSNWLPGQGGFLDRFDSFLAAGALYYLLLITIFKETWRPFVQGPA